MSYCQHLTDRQLNNVYFDEKARIRQSDAEGEVSIAACQMLLEAQMEAKARGFTFDKSAWEPAEWIRRSEN